jgi:hypothetical protein
MGAMSAVGTSRPDEQGKRRSAKQTLSIDGNDANDPKRRVGGERSCINPKSRSRRNPSRSFAGKNIECLAASFCELGHFTAIDCGVRCGPGS